MSSLSKEKSQILKLSLTLDGVTDLHTIEPPIWACQRKTTCAVVFSCFAANFFPQKYKHGASTIRDMRVLTLGI